MLCEKGWKADSDAEDTEVQERRDQIDSEVACGPPTEPPKTLEKTSKELNFGRKETYRPTLGLLLIVSDPAAASM